MQQEYDSRGLSKVMLFMLAVSILFCAEIEHNYTQIKADVKKIVANELQRIANDPALQHLIKKDK